MIDGLYQFLASIGFNEPLHPPITHMPVGLVAGALIFFLVAIILKRKNFVPCARHVAILAFVFAFPTILFGVFDWLYFYKAALITPIIIKMILAGLVVIVLGTGIILGSEIKLHSMWMTIIYALAFICVIGLGYFGAGLIYGRGTSESATSLTEQQRSGREIFARNCTACHANGGNSINPEYPLRTTVLLENREEFIAFLRNPAAMVGESSRMPLFSEERMSDQAATAVYDYIKAMVATTWK